MRGLSSIVTEAELILFPSESHLWAGRVHALSGLAGTWENKGVRMNSQNPPYFHLYTRQGRIFSHENE